MKTIHVCIALCPVDRCDVCATGKVCIYFIGDGMGVNQVNGTENVPAWKDALAWRRCCSLSFRAGAHHFSPATTPVTDLPLPELYGHRRKMTMLASVWMTRRMWFNQLCRKSEEGREESRCKSTSVSVDHATPAAFYAHQPNSQHVLWK